ncbi:unnamed protein product, partial [Ectocarpus sp. 12 AP-2014]
MSAGKARALLAAIVLAAGVPLALLAHRLSGSTTSARSQVSISAPQAGTQARLIDFKWKARSEEIAIHPVGQQSASDHQGVEVLQEGSGGGGTDVETTMTSTTEFNRNGGTLVAPWGGGSVDSAKTCEEDEAFFATGDADTRHQHQHPPGWTKNFKNVFTKSSGRKLLLMAKDLEKVYVNVEDTAASALIFYASLRFGGKTPALLASLATGAALSSVVSAASTSVLSAGTTCADMSDIDSGGTTSVPGDSTDEATWTLFVCIISIGVVMVVAWIVWLSPLWVLLNLFVWAESRSRRKVSSGSPNIQATGAVATAPEMPARSIRRRHAPRSPRSPRHAPRSPARRSPHHIRRSLSH